MILYCPCCGRPLEVEPEIRSTDHRNAGIEVVFRGAFIEHECGGEQ